MNKRDFILLTAHLGSLQALLDQTVEICNRVNLDSLSNEDKPPSKSADSSSSDSSGSPEQILKDIKEAITGVPEIQAGIQAARDAKTQQELEEKAQEVGGRTAPFRVQVIEVERDEYSDHDAPIMWIQDPDTKEKCWLSLSEDDYAHLSERLDLGELIYFPLTQEDLLATAGRWVPQV